MKVKNIIFGIFLLISNGLWSQKSEVKLLFTGDIMGHGPQIESAYDAKTKTYDYNNCFLYIKNHQEKWRQLYWHSSIPIHTFSI